MGKIDSVSVADMLGPRRAQMAMFQADSASLAVFGLSHQREFDCSPWPIRIFDHQTLRYIAVNDAAVAFYGYSREEFLQLSISDTRHPDEHHDIYPPRLRPTSHLRHGPARRHVKKSGEAAIVELIMQDMIFNGRVARLALTIDITERSRLVELTRQREREFATLVQHSPDVIARLDRDFRHLYVNPGIATAGNRRPAEYFIGKKISEIEMPADLVALWDAALTRAFALGTEQSLECTFDTPSGPKYYESRIIPECDDHGKVTTVLTVTRDFTERKEAERSAERSAALARLLEALARAANEATTPEAGMVECLKLICTYGNWTIGRVALFGENGPSDVAPHSMWYSADLERFSGFIKVSNGRYQPGGGAFLNRLLIEQQPVWIEDVAAETRMGRRELVLEYGLRSAFAFPIIIKGTIVAMMEVFSEARHPLDPLTMGVAQSLASQLARIIERDWANRWNARMAALVESSQDAIITRSLDGKILTWNRGAQRLLGYTAAEAIGRDISFVVPPEIREEITQKRITIHGGLPVPTYETTRMAKDGRRITVSSSPTLIRDADKGIWGVSTIMRDMTDRKEAEAKRLADVMKQRDALVREVHHRIKNSIQGVTGLLRQRLRGHVGPAPELESAIAQLQSVAAVYGLQSGVSASVNLCELLRAIGSSAMHLTGGKISHVVKPGAAARAHIVDTEAVAIAVLLNELLFNALKHTTGETREVELAMHACEGGVEIKVTNAGLLPAGFDLERGRGTGEGLNLVRTLIPRHCCDLTIASRAGLVEARLAVRSPVVFAVAAADSMPVTHLQPRS